jgi:hypothetical protein
MGNNKLDRRRFFTPEVEDISEEKIEMEERLNELALFEEFRNSVLPAMQALVARKAPPAEIYDTFKSLLAARQVSIALTSRDPGKALAAITDVINRLEGKPIERKEFKHQLGQLKDEELDSLLESRLKDVSEVDDK